MQFSLTTITAIMATGVFAAPSANQAANILVTDVAVAPMPAEALAAFEAKVVTPGPAANVPATNAPLSKEKRDITHLYICQDSNFSQSGRCQNLDSNRQQCYNLQNGWNDVVSSLGPDKGTTCCIYDDYGCNGGSLCGIVNPGIYNLADYKWNDRASAYRCW